MCSAELTWTDIWMGLTIAGGCIVLLIVAVAVFFFFVDR